jgi:hypothetical protein
MKFSITTSKRKKRIWENQLIHFLMKIVITPIVFIFGILAVIYVGIYDFIKHKVFGIKDKPIEYKAPILFENDNFKLIKEHIFGGIQEHKIATDFLFSIVDYDDELEIFKVIDENQKTELNGEFLTGFYADFKNEILLQRIKSNSKGEPTSELISFEKNTGKIKVFKEIGIYGLYKYDNENKIILGENKTDEIKIRIKASA